MKSLEDQGKLTDELSAKILQAETLAVLEDLYLPFRPKRRTRATIAREKGLEPLAPLLFAQEPTTDPLAEADRFINPEKEVYSAEEALAGARDIIAEWVNENTEARAKLRTLFTDRGVIRSRVITGKESRGHPVPRLLRLGRIHRKSSIATGFWQCAAGRRRDFSPSTSRRRKRKPCPFLNPSFVKGDSAASQQVKAAVHDSYKRLLSPSLETEAKQWSKERADQEAIQIFADNLRHLLMAAPLGSRRIMAIDPGFRTGCKLVCLDPQGKLIHNETIYPHSGAQAVSQGGRTGPGACR